ncbi:MAG: GNAT family N-acetyltransferase [Solirubrobacteraceae bacterium]
MSVSQAAADSDRVEGNGLSVRRYRPGDEHAIQVVFETVFGRKRSLEEWRWRFQEPPSGTAMLHVLENEDGIVGHMSHIAFPTWVDGQRLVVGQGGDTMTLPACRGKGGMRQLLDAALSEHNYDLRMNFPSAMARPLFVRYGAGTVVGTLPSWIRRHSLTRPVPALAAPLARTALAAGNFAADRPRPRVTVEALEELGAEVDELAEASASFARCIRIRESAYLRWRWLAQPDARWEIRAARAEDGRLIGFSVLGLEAAGAQGRTGWINDLLAPDRQTLRALLVDGVASLVAQGAGSVRCHYLDPRPWARRVFLRSGFLPMGEEHPFVVRSLSPGVGDAPERQGSWYLTRSDTEPWPSLTEI